MYTGIHLEAVHIVAVAIASDHAVFFKDKYALSMPGNSQG
jgi:hypothetical protein